MSVLSDLFQNIADAIRTKTGDTATMAPASFPEKILAIEAGGGSSGASGAYWGETMAVVRNQYRRTYFNFNGELYAFSCTTESSSSNVQIQKYNASANSWTTVVAKGWVATVNAFFTYGYVVEMNGVAHFIDGDNKFHYTWDGSSAPVAKTKFTKTTADGDGCVCVVNDELYILVSDNIVYKWDESSDTWTAFYTTTSYQNTIFERDGILHIAQRSNGEVYKIVDGVAELVTTLEFETASGRLAYYNGYLYWCKGASYAVNPIYRYDITTGEKTFLLNAPYTGVYGTLACIDNEVCFCGGQYAYCLRLILHES